MSRPLHPLKILLACTILIAPGEAFANSKGKEEKAAPVTYFALQPLTAVAVRRDGRRGVLTVEAGIQADDAKLMERAQQSTPRLRAAFAQVLMSYAAGMRRGDPPDVDYLGREMQKSADHVLGKSGTRVLLGSALMN